MIYSKLLGSLKKARVLCGMAGLALIASAAPAHAQVSTSQTTSNQLNQLLMTPTTNNKSSAGEWYATLFFRYLSFQNDFDQFHYQAQGQYSFTDQLAAGLWIPVEHNNFGDSHTGFGDVTFYGQYKLDQLISHDVVDLTAEADVVLPTGTFSEGLESGRFGFRPKVLAYKEFDNVGPGNIGVYADIGFTITTHSDFRMDLAATYEWQKIVGILEFYDQAGDKMGSPQVYFTPGAAYRGLGPWEFALGVPIGMNDASADVGVSVKATYAFQR